ncbi:zinc finger FYVE domain-containing protein 26 homolog [Anopheles cruzii]|uniref:zinc finger FYVE domain-containing protein 26 homolog n=1 Tax=Anopheles cruzii TaxID=68878 RepID=UPI0022EC8AF0|nr:zinc finger FYVE domain-containing protein 26 homolog [Anopheles cruzii]
MEYFNEYWELFVDKKDSIAKELIAYYKTLDDHEDGSELSEQCRTFLTKNLLINPYPTCQVLKLLAASKIHGKNTTIHEFATAAVIQAIERNGDQELSASKCYSILANSLVSVKAINHLKACINRALDRKSLDLQPFVLALFSRRSFKLLVNLLPELSGHLNQQHTADALEKKLHFFHSILENDSGHPTYSHHTAYLHFLRQVLLVNQGGLLPPLESSATVDEEPFQDRSYLRAYQIELQRVLLLHQALSIEETLLPVPEFSQYDSVIGMMAKGKTNIIDHDFTTLFEVIRTNQKMLAEIGSLLRTGSAKNEENYGTYPNESSAVIILQMTVVLYKAIEASFGTQQTETVAQSNLDTQLKCLLKEADMPTFVYAIESMLTMLFVRGELAPKAAYERKHFMCNVSLLNSVALSVKSIMITRKHSATFTGENDKLSRRFQNLFELVNDICWRLSLFADNLLGRSVGEQPTSDTLRLSDMPPVPMVLTHVTENYSEASGPGNALYRSVESMMLAEPNVARHGGYGTLPKHKSASRRHARGAGAAPNSGNSGGSNKEASTQRSLSNDSKVDSALFGACAVRGKHRDRAFTSLLATPETLAIVCLTSDKLPFAKQIIESYALQDCPVGCLVSRMEQMATLRSNLTGLVQKNERKQEDSPPPSGSDSDTLLNDIRTRTAVGFEVSKVLSTIETFLKSQTPTGQEAALDDGTVLAPMDRFVGRYPFLGAHTGKNLHLSQIVDVVLDLPFKYELNLSIYNFLLKNVHRTTVRGMSASTISEGNGGLGGGGIGMQQLVGNFVSFFGTIIDTMHIALKTAREVGHARHLTIGQLLSREVCPLNTVENGVCLKRRARFHTTVMRHFRSNGDTTLEGSASICQTNQYLQQLQLLIQSTAVDTVSPSFATDDLLRMDVRRLLLDALFDKRISLSALDSLAAKLGINLVQTVGHRLLGSPPPTVGSHECDTTLWQFIEGKNELLFSICQAQLRAGSVAVEKDVPSSLIVQYNDFRKAAFENTLPMRCNRSWLRPDELQSESFPLEIGRACCLLPAAASGPQNDSSGGGSCWSINASVRSIEQQVIALLQSVDQFPNASRWISASEHLLTALLRPTMDPTTCGQLQAKAAELRTYVRVGELLKLQPADDWRNVRAFSLENKSHVLQQLIEQQQYQVAQEWIKLHPIDPDSELDMFMYAVRKAHTGAVTPELASEPATSMCLLFGIIETMPSEAVLRLYEAMIINIKSVPIVSYILRYLQRHGEQQPLYQKYQLSLTIFEHLTHAEYDGLWNLVSRPLLILEQCLMNSRLELLDGVIHSVRPLLSSEICGSCFEHREYIRDLHENVQGATGEASCWDPIHEGLYIRHECVDCLLRIYASKALEYKVFSEHDTRDYRDSLATASASSLDSLAPGLEPCRLPFVMPKEVPPRERWVKDEDALHCMSCRRTFSMLNRRHHCRRCGRVVCHACSKCRERIGGFYEEVAVRICDDCGRCLGESVGSPDRPVVPEVVRANRAPGPSGAPVTQFEWQLTGNERYDRVIRDEYSYEYAPSTGQCLAICDLHTANEEIASFLLYHCAKLEALLRPLAPGFPNPEIDYALVARMLLNLTLGVKVRGADGGAGVEVEKMKEHAEIILSIVHDNCESLLLHSQSQAAISSHGSLRRLRDALVKAEKWPLALELSLKCGFSVSGVLAAWGMTCLRAGCYETAREKFSHCLPRIASEADCDALLRMIEAPPPPPGSPAAAKRGPVPSPVASGPARMAQVKRPARSPPLLGEILYALKCTTRVIDPLMEQVAVGGRNSGVGGSGLVGQHEPATNILNTLANLRLVAQGEFSEALAKVDRQSVANGTTPRRTTVSLMCTRLFEESMHYLLAYGSHQSIVVFLMKHQQTETAALRYILMQHVDPEVFLQAILLPCLQRGQLETLVQQLTVLDETLYEWRDHLRYVCRYLETNEMLNSLYSLQLLLKDPIRASMTCVRFYSMGCRTFNDLHAAEHHLKTSVTHLQNELELCNWQEVRLNSVGSTIETHPSLLMKLDPKELNNHINTILLQLEVTKFLAKCEAKGRQTTGLLTKISKDNSQLPTLFGSVQDKLQLAILTLVCGQNVEEAFGLSYRIIQDYNLELHRVYALTAKYFINHGKIEDVGKLLDAIVSNGGSTTAEPMLSSVCDEIVRISVDAAIARHGSSGHTKVALEALINRITSVGVRIHCYIASSQLKTAYLLANRHHRTGDIRKILRHAEFLGQLHVKRLCEARLNHHEGEGS